MGVVIGAQEASDEIDLAVRCKMTIKVPHHGQSVEQMSDVGGKIGTGSDGLTLKPAMAGVKQNSNVIMMHDLT